MISDKRKSATMFCGAHFQVISTLSYTTDEQLNALYSELPRETHSQEGKRVVLGPKKKILHFLIEFDYSVKVVVINNLTE